MTGQYRAPARLLHDLGITEPEDIDLDAIAFSCGALVVRDRLDGCEARLLGAGERAFITVNSASDTHRQRFSIGHELGHWMHDRGNASFRCSKRDFVHSWGEMSPEKRANQYAAELLLPRSMFRPRAERLPMTLETASALADLFQASLTATAIRLVEHGSFPAMVLLSGSNGIRWSFRGQDVPSEIRLRDRPGVDSCAADLLADAGSEGPTDVCAGAWFEGSEAQRFAVCEDSRRVTRNDVLTMLWWRDEGHLLVYTEKDDSETGS